MDLNDPRRRLQMAKVSSPSLRAVAAPKQTLTVAEAKPRQLSVAQANPVRLRIAEPTPIRLSNAPAQQPALSVAGAKPNVPSQTQTDVERSRGWSRIADVFKPVSQGGVNVFADAANFVKDAVVEPVMKFGSKAANTAAIPLVGIPGVIDAQLTGGQEGANKLNQLEAAIEDFRKNSFVSKDVATGKASVGEFARDFTKTGVEGATYVLPTAKLAQGASLGSRLLVNSGANAGLNAAADASLQALEKGEVDLKQVAVSAGAGAILGLIGARGDGKAVSNLAESIAKESDPAVIKAVLGVDDEMATYLTNETSKKSIENVVKELAVDPEFNLSDAMRKRLQEEGVTAVRKKGNKYGAEYDPNDASINLRDKSFATDSNLFHELGHHIYVTKLTPE